MKHTLEKCINTVQRNRQKFRRYVSLLLVLSMLTTLGVNRGLLQNGMSLSHTADYICGLEEHVHTEDCYEKVLICGYDDEEAESAEDTSDTAPAARTTETVSPERSAADFEAVDAADPAETDSAESALSGISKEQTALTGETAEVTEDQNEVPDGEENSGDFEGETEYESPYKRGTIIRDEDNRLNLGFLTRIGAAIEGLLQDANDIGKVYAAADDGTRKTTASASDAQASGTTAETKNTAENTAGTEESKAGTEETTGAIETAGTEESKAGTEETTGAIETTGAAEETPAAETAAVADGTEKRHVHTDACYKKKLICGMKEHVHTPECLLSVQVTGKEKAEDWEATLPELEEYTGIWAWDLVLVAQSQIGYIESVEDFLVSDDGDVRNGYTRYGAWYGNEYAEWSSMFAAFCLYYAGVPTDAMPVNSGCVAWAAALKKAELYRQSGEYEPKVGDIVFLDTEKDDGKSDRVGIIEELIYEDGSRSGDLAEFEEIADIDEIGENNEIGDSEDPGVISETSASDEGEALRDANDADENPDLTETAAAAAEIAVSGELDGTGDLDETEDTVPDEDASAKTVVGFTAIVGDIDGAVEEIEYTVDDEMIRGYAELPENSESGNTELAASRRVTLATDSNADAAATDSNADKLLPEEPATDSNAKKEVTYPAFTDEQTMEDGTVIHVDAPEGAFPEGIQLKLEKRDAAEYLDAIRAFTGNEELTADYWLAYDFDFYTDEENHNIEPNTEIHVTFSNLEAFDTFETKIDDTSDAGDAKDPVLSVDVFHIGDVADGESTEVSRTTICSVDVNKNIVEIESSQFSTQLLAPGGGSGGNNADHIDLAVTANASVTINGKLYEVPVNLTSADITSQNFSAAYKNGSTVTSWNITGLSTSHGGTEYDEKGVSQIRANGRFPVGTKSNPILYTIAVDKTVTFDIDKPGSTTGETITVDVPVTLSATFGYWDDDNICPAIRDPAAPGQAANLKNWKSGSFINACGFDFALDFQLKLVVIAKQVVDASGKELNVSNYQVYFNVNNSSDSKAAEILLNATGYGLAIEQVDSLDGLTITEQTPPQTVTVDGKTYNYLKTVINGREVATGSGSEGFQTSGVDSFTVQNVYYAPGLTVNKVWEDNDASDRPTKITVKLLKNGQETGETATLNAENGWSYTFTNLDSNATYTVEEVVPSGYIVSYQYTGQSTGTSEARWIRTDSFVDGETYLIVTSPEAGEVYGMTALEKGFRWTYKNGAGKISVSQDTDGSTYITDTEAKNHENMQWTAAFAGTIKGEQVGYRNAYTLKSVSTDKYAKSNGDGELTSDANDKANYFYYGYTKLDANGDAAKRQPSNGSEDWSYIIGSMNDYFLLKKGGTGDGNAEEAQPFYLYKRVEQLGTGQTVTITNTRTYSLPSTGGAGTTPFTVGGSVLTGAALLYGYHLMRKREGGTE